MNCFLCTICDNCGLDKPDTTLRLNPFVYEMYQERLWEWWCNDCYELAKEEIGENPAGGSKDEYYS